MTENKEKTAFRYSGHKKSAQFKLASLEKPESILSFNLHSV